MRRLFEWLKIVVEKRPILFVLVGGPISYALGMVVLFTIFVPTPIDHLGVLWSGMTFGALIPVSFHWFVARHERNSLFAQVLALIPAVFLFALVSMAAGLVGVKTQSCIEDPVTKEVRDCRSEWRGYTPIRDGR